jgi:peptidoglycan/LPS O-acetylase OafA/YrhL
MLNSIQSIRALATLTVVVFHAIELVTTAWGLPLPLPTAGVGVLDVFFVLSGFLMIHIMRRDETPGGFLFKRFTRIVPLYWLMTTLAIVGTIGFHGLFPLANLSPLSILSSYFFVPHPNAGGDLEPILSVGWTINIEIWFFFSFALALTLPWGRRTAGVVLMLGVLWLAAHMLLAGSAVEVFHADKFLIDLMIGCLLAPAARLPEAAAFARRTPMLPIIIGAWVVMLALGPLSCGDQACETKTPMTYALSIPAGILVLAAALQDLYRTPTKRNPLVFYGDASYSVYLLHIFVVRGVSAAALTLLGPSPASAMLALALIFAVTFSLAPLLYFCVELKCNQMLRKASWPSFLRLRQTRVPLKPKQLI